MSNIYTMIKTPTLVAEKGHESVRKTLHVSSDNAVAVEIGLILTAHDVKKCGVLELCRKCGLDDVDTLKALRQCEWDRNYLHYTTNSYYVECISKDKGIARINMEDYAKLYITQEIADMLHGRVVYDKWTTIQHIKDLALFCSYYGLNINNVAGIFNVNDKYNNR